MPIANVHLAAERPLDADALIARWCTFSEISADEMTVNIVELRAQAGRPYDAMAWLYLPSRWTKLEREDLGLALSRALAEGIGVPTERIFVALTILDPGHVFESGRVMPW